MCKGKIRVSMFEPFSFLKICDAGYQPIGYECQNINECVLGMHNCSSNGYCTDTQGQWILECFENLTSIKSY